MWLLDDKPELIKADFLPSSLSATPDCAALPEKPKNECVNITIPAATPNFSTASQWYLSLYVPTSTGTVVSQRDSRWAVVLAPGLLPEIWNGLWETVPARSSLASGSSRESEIPVMSGCEVIYVCSCIGTVCLNID